MNEFDKLYNIMDYNGNYYNVGAKNKLIRAFGKEDAGIFNFVQVNKLIDDKKSQQLISIPIDEDCDFECSDIVPIDFNREDKLCSNDEEIDCAEKTFDDLNMFEIDLCEYMRKFLFIASNIKSYKNELIKRESDIDQKITDVLHYIELCETDESDAVGLMELLRENSECRRKVKDEIAKIDIFNACMLSGGNEAKAGECVKRIEKLDKRKYKPRKLADLFENCTMRKDSGKTEEKPGNIKAKEREIIMERRETVFDGRKNDWQEFMERQIAFFENAEQYIFNLSEDINDLDNEIENTLYQAESLRCNAAQGYNVFKRIKCLRNERRDKIKELNCLKLMTEGIDCREISSVLKYNSLCIDNMLGCEEKGDEDCKDKAVV